MNLINDFKKTLTLEEYLPILGNQRSLHELHYRRVCETYDLKLNAFQRLKVLVITEPWCADSTAILPVIQKVFENKSVEIRIALKREHPELMNRFLTDGKQAIPVVIVMDIHGNYLFHFGPRPKAAQAIFEKYRTKINNGNIDRKEVTKKIRKFYAHDRGCAIIQELLSHFKQVMQT